MTDGAKLVAITGASRGLGEALARGFWAQGVDLLLGSRDLAAMEKVAASLKPLVRPLQKVLCQRLDLQDEATLPAFMARAGEWPALDVLVNNAGDHGSIGALQECDWPGWEKALRINLLAPARLCQLAIPMLKKSGQGRILNISGGGATGPRPNFTAYAAAKTGLVRLTETLAQELKGTGVTVNAIAPGVMKTALLKQVVEAGKEQAGEKAFDEAGKFLNSGEDSIPKAVALALFLAGPQAQGITGRLISAVWDDWKSLADRTGELEGSDIYTLRRIVPKDRGKDWD